MGREEEIKVIAHHIWEEEGYCDGCEVEHWLRAEVIWQEKQKNNPASAQAKAKTKQTAKPGKKESASKKR